MKTSLTYGFIIALCGALISMGSYFAGWHDTPDKLDLAHNLGTVLGLIVAIVGIVLGIKEKRSLLPADASWGYGSALGTGILIGLFAAILGSIYSYCYFAFINPHITDVIYQAQVAKMEAKGMSAEQIERAEPMMRKFMGPVFITISSFVIGFVVNTVLSLIIAAFLKNRPAQQPPVAG